MQLQLGSAESRLLERQWALYMQAMRLGLLWCPGHEERAGLWCNACLQVDTQKGSYKWRLINIMVRERKSVKEKLFGWKSTLPRLSYKRRNKTCISLGYRLRPKMEKEKTKKTNPCRLKYGNVWICISCHLPLHILLHKHKRTSVRLPWQAPNLHVYKPHDTQNVLENSWSTKELWFNTFEPFSHWANSCCVKVSLRWNAGTRPAGGRREKKTKKTQHSVHNSTF